ncbi:chemotaxis protein CheD [Dissulfurirhabdus thermomarina]|uniref:Chemotaxis protein CheD n=1 Tax=Dissulfurirhabdus thermomarina TaxID=1765737 RepID=A0A6N9TJ55_DISTH|nr:chemotaxis protein CheD [Dissulfurirhabdus thermomarina]NDY41291.1 chemotaxis protein CheD [Dissulfurirhabdus thermomarina]NMX23748.1 chemotaxis protein CheD [Dissulfurirhabdus thermomarina]
METLEVHPGTHAVAAGRDTILEARSLGATLAVAAWDEAAGVGGLLVCAFLKTPGDFAPAGPEPLESTERGLKAFFAELVDQAAQPARLKVYLAGTAEFLSAPDALNLGARLRRAVRKVLEQNGVAVAAEHVGGAANRDIRLDTRTGGVTVTVDKGREVRL